MTRTQNGVQVMGYEDSALAGESIMFTCTSGLEFSGPNSSTCMGNGEWEPDPEEVNCTGKHYINNGILINLYIVELIKLLT